MDAATLGTNPTLATYVTVGLLAIVPLLFVAMTCFTRFVIVFAMLRHGLGLQQSPPNIVLVALSLLLTLFVMQPVFERLQSEALTPFLGGKLTLAQAADAAEAPLRQYMSAQVREQELAAVLEIAPESAAAAATSPPLASLTVAFLLGELRIAFQMGFFLLLPFLLIDLVVSSVLMGLGMIMVPPQSISLPLKVLVFLLVDGWIVLTQSIAGSIHGVGP